MILFPLLSSCAHLPPLKRIAFTSPSVILKILSHLPERNSKFHILEKGEESLDLRYEDGWSFAEIHVHLYPLPEGETLIHVSLSRSTLFFPREKLWQEFLGILEDLLKEGGVSIVTEMDIFYSSKGG